MAINTDLQQVHRLPFPRRHCATVLPTWVKRVGERGPKIAYNSASVLECHRCFMKRTDVCNISIQPGSSFPATTNIGFDTVLLSCACSAHAKSGQPVSPTDERRNHRDDLPRRQPATLLLPPNVQAMPRTLRVLYVTRGGMDKLFDQ